MRKLTFLMIATLGLISCGGSGGSSNTQEGTTTPTENETIISGGTPDEPASIRINKTHKISNNIFYNYFKYSGNKKEKVFIHTILTIPMSDSDKANCAWSPSSYDTQIIVYNSNNETVQLACGESMLFAPPKDGQYIFYFNFPSNGSGVFNIASITNKSAITNPAGTIGSPSSPRFINTTESNNIDSNSFLNYYQYTANRNDKLVINVLLDQPLSEAQKAKCGFSPGTDSEPSQNDTQINIYDSSYVRAGGICGESYTFTFPETGTYIFQFSYATQSSGTFNAALINAEFNF